VPGAPAVAGAPAPLALAAPAVAGAPALLALAALTAAGAFAPSPTGQLTPVPPSPQ